MAPGADTLLRLLRYHHHRRRRRRVFVVGQARRRQLDDAEKGEANKRRGTRLALGCCYVITLHANRPRTLSARSPRFIAA